MKHKIIGTIISLAGLFLVAKYKLHLVGLILIIVGVYYAIGRGVKPK